MLPLYIRHFKDFKHIFQWYCLKFVTIRRPKGCQPHQTEIYVLVRLPYKVPPNTCYFDACSHIVKRNWI